MHIAEVDLNERCNKRTCRMDRIDSADRGGILSDRYICRTENAGKRFIYGDNFVGRRSPYRR